MKKIYLMLLAAGMFAMVACGGGQEGDHGDEMHADSAAQDAMDQLEDEMGGDEPMEADTAAGEEEMNMETDTMMQDTADTGAEDM